MDRSFPKRRSSPRLKGFDYVGFHAYAVTVATANRRRCFLDGEAVTSVRAVMEEEAERHGFDLFCYCFMPDHLHVLLQGRTEASDLGNFVRALKQRSSFEARRQRGCTLWQRSYYDHVIRSDEVLNKVALYILENPVRRGLCRDWRKYHGSGGRLREALLSEAGGQT